MLRKGRPESIVCVASIENNPLENRSRHVQKYWPGSQSIPRRNAGYVRPMRVVRQSLLRGIIPESFRDRLCTLLVEERHFMLNELT
jgi:hypothetical protein